MSRKPKTAAATSAASTDAVDGAGIGQTTDSVDQARDASATAGLYGSSVQPSILVIGGQEIQLGTVVAAAHKASELTVDEWNALAVDVREELIAAEIASLQADADAAAAEAAAAEAAAAEAAAAEAAAAEAAAADVATGYPRSVTLRNHGSFAVTEPSTRAYVGGGSSVLVVVHDHAQAVLLLQNAAAIKASTGGRQSIDVIGLEDVSIPEGEQQ